MLRHRGADCPKRTPATARMQWEALLAACQAALLLVAVLTPVLMGTVVAGVYYLEPSFRRNFFIAKAFPQPRGLPFFGNLLQIALPRDQLFRLLRRWRADFGSRYVISMFYMTFFHISEPESVEVGVGQTASWLIRLRSPGITVPPPHPLAYTHPGLPAAVT
ncbi:hypothetical protein ONE63_000045 [Megalurothrips usitatus]|uniref:Uncharacterized protein n=1 Tax=Megalurothrips usitatus TaxID=439358 RepID=A0AAV7XZR8_9NEOP|nr:hypothetical protein ONE63_000045 [Megalurothrips usitatus]